MKKIPTLFKRKYDDKGKIIGITSEIDPRVHYSIAEMIPTVKLDGTCCAIIDGKFYRRYDAKHGKTPPEGAIPCQRDPDPTTGHWPHWVLIGDSPSDKWHVKARSQYGVLPDGTYELIGKHFQGNPYKLTDDHLVAHGSDIITGLNPTFVSIGIWLKEHDVEGIVFWDPSMSFPVCKIKRTDFGLKWPLSVKQEGIDQ